MKPIVVPQPKIELAAKPHPAEPLPPKGAYAAAAKEWLETDDWIVFNEDPAVEYRKGGAFVAAWVWVDDDEARDAQSIVDEKQDDEDAKIIEFLDEEEFDELASYTGRRDPGEEG